MWKTAPARVRSKIKKTDNQRARKLMLNINSDDKNDKNISLHFYNSYIKDL